MDDVKFAYPSLLDTVSDETASAQFISLKGASQVSEISYRPISGSNTNTLVFSILPPSTSTILDSTLLLEMDITINLGFFAGDDRRDFGYTCLESWPIQKAIQNISISVNGLVLTHQPYSFQSIYERLEIDDDMRKRYYSLFPSRLNETTYGRGANPFSYYDMMTKGGVSNPFSAQEWDGCTRFEPSRFEFGPRVDVLDPNNGDPISRTYRVVEPISLGGLFRDAQSYGITNINKLDITIQFGDMVNLSVCNPRDPAAGNAVSNFNPGDIYFADTPLPQGQVSQIKVYNTGAGSGTVANGLNHPAPLTVTRANELLRLRYMTSSATIPSVVKLPYTQILPYVNSYPGTKLPGAANGATPSVTKVSVNAIKSSMVPSFIYIVARPKLLSKTSFDMDILLPIRSLSLIVGNNVGIMSGASPQQLYQISMRNGYNLSWNQWRKQCVMCIQVGEDIPGVPGAIGQWSLQAEVGVGWHGDNEFVVDLEVDIFLSNDGQIEISRDMAQLRMGIQTAAVAEEIEAPPTDNPEGAGYGRRHGGSFKSFFRSVGKLLKPVGKAVLPIAERVLTNVATKGLTAMVGAGEGGGRQLGGRQLGGAAERRQMMATKMLS